MNSKMHTGERRDLRHLNDASKKVDKPSRCQHIAADNTSSVDVDLSFPSPPLLSPSYNYHIRSYN